MKIQSNLTIVLSDTFEREIKVKLNKATRVGRRKQKKF